MYGDKVVNADKPDDRIPGANRVRGWFPRKCAVELAENDVIEDTTSSHNKKKESKKIK